jgi:hypothetical protein
MLREGPRNGVSTSKGRDSIPYATSKLEKGIVAKGGVLMGVEIVLEAELEDLEKAAVISSGLGTPQLLHKALRVKGMMSSSSLPFLLRASLYASRLACKKHGMKCSKSMDL